MNGVHRRVSTSQVMRRQSSYMTTRHSLIYQVNETLKLSSLYFQDVRGLLLATFTHACRS